MEIVQTSLRTTDNQWLIFFLELFLQVQLTNGVILAGEPQVQPFTDTSRPLSNEASQEVEPTAQTESVT